MYPSAWEKTPPITVTIQTRPKNSNKAPTTFKTTFIVYLHRASRWEAPTVLEWAQHRSHLRRHGVEEQEKRKHRGDTMERIP